MARVLVVEDDEFLSRQLRDWCLHHKCEVDVVSSGLEALEHLQFAQYDLVFMDWRLPEMTGIDVCKEYRSAGGTAPILMLSGNSSDEHRAAGLDAGANDFLQKPFTIQQLTTKFNSLLNRP
jgi:DNA-binding response OmpR family regulator